MYLIFKKDAIYIDHDKKEALESKLDDSNSLKRLAEIVKLEEGLTLGDVFNVMSTYPTLTNFISQYSLCSAINDFHEQAKLPQVKNEEVEYAEVNWHYSSTKTKKGGKSKTYIDLCTNFHGVGVSKTKEHNNNDGKCNFSLSYCPVNEITDLPIRLNTEFLVKNGNASYTAEKNFTLLEFLDAIYDDISFAGGVESKKEFIEELQESVKDIEKRIENGEEPFVDLDELLSNNTYNTADLGPEGVDNNESV